MKTVKLTLKLRIKKYNLRKCILYLARQYLTLEKKLGSSIQK